jgi:hypothetical protein
VFYFGVLAKWFFLIADQIGAVFAVSGLEVLTSPPFRPYIFLATILLSDLF